MSKGSRYRTLNTDKFNNNYDQIFKEKSNVKPADSQPTGKTIKAEGSKK